MAKKRKRRNTVAADLRTPKYRPRVVKSKKVYSRKGKHGKTEA
jgi:stalled ribosome alternative rescue factor ArfA